MVLNIPTRPNLAQGGTLGRKIELFSNHLQIDLSKLKGTIIWHYDVDIKPDRPKAFLKRVVEEFRKRNCPRYFPAFDGNKNLFSVGPLPFGDQVLILFQENNFCFT